LWTKAHRARHEPRLKELISSRAADEMAAVINNEDLDVTADSFLILKNAGPVGAGMPEWGMMPIPKKLLKEGVRDMLRMSDARMSGTSYGACILHVSPEAAVGGPFALVRTGDIIEIDVPARQLNMLVSEDELARTRAALAAAKALGVRLGNPSPDLGKARARASANASRFRGTVAPLVQRLRSEGLSLRQVAAELNARGIKTTRGRRWQAASILGVLNATRSRP
jgi:hypothetical protein